MLKMVSGSSGIQHAFRLRSVLPLKRRHPALEVTPEVSLRALLIMKDECPGLLSPCPSSRLAVLGQGASLFSECLVQPLLKERDLQKSHVRIPISYSRRKHLSVPLHEPAVRPPPSCCVLPHQVNSVCWASLNHLDSHILYLLTDETVWWAGPALMWTGVYGVCEAAS